MAEIEILGSEALDIDLRDYPVEVTRATVRALNRAIKSSQSVMTKEIAGDTGLKQKAVRAAMSLSEATALWPEAKLGATMKRIPLMQFHAKGPRPSRGRGKGVTWRLRGGKSRAANAFIATMKSGHEGVFKRVGKARLGITELHGPSIGIVFKKFRPLGLARALEVFQKNFDHELEFAKGRADAGTD